MLLDRRDAGATGLRPRKNVVLLVFPEGCRKLSRSVGIKKGVVHVRRAVEGRRSSSGEPSQGGPGAVDELLRLYQGKIFNLAMSILKNESDAEEAAQDVFMTVIRKVETFQGNSAFYWIYRICVNTCLMRLRGKRRNETVSIEEFMPVFTDEGMHASPMDDWSKEVERDALNEELGRMIRKYTEELSEKYRVVFVLSDVEGLSNEETAKILGLTVPAIKSRLHRARLYLREQLSRYLLEGKAGYAMNCKKDLAYMLADYCNGSMDPRLREELDDHLSRCEPCMAFTKTFRATCEGTRKLREAIEYAIPAEVRERLDMFVRAAALKFPEKLKEYRNQVERDRREKVADRPGGGRRETPLGRGAPSGEPLRRMPGVQRVYRRGAESRRLPGRRSSRGYPVPPHRADAGDSPGRGALPGVVFPRSPLPHETTAWKVQAVPTGILIQ